ncbi:MAG: peptide ligase PGM1-related protein [Acidimicrobiia bacterium]
MPQQIDVHDQASYDVLQAKLVPLWKSIERFNTDEQTIVVVPSVHVDVELTASQLQAYEERYLFLLFLLRQPRARIVFVTGQAINADIIDYYLDLMPGVIQSHARSRLFFVSPMEATYRALSDKLLERPRLIDRIRDLIVDPERAHLVPFMTTWSDRELAMRLGIPMYGADPKDVHFGTKSEGRKLFARAGISHPAGAEDLHSLDDIVVATMRLLADSTTTDRFVIKHNEGVSGFGNAIFDLTNLPIGTVGAGVVKERIRSMTLNEHAGSIDKYLETLAIEGGIVETMIKGDDLPSPSVQMRITPLGRVEVLSTHDQILGGEGGQVFLGSRFPANPEYAVQISRSARRVGELLAERGIIGRFAIDFMMTRTGAGWQDHAIELNLRKGGTTHPFLTLQFLTDGNYDEASGHFLAPSGRRKYYVTTDHLEVDGLKRLTPQDLLDIALLEDLHFSQATQTGSVFHMLSALPTHGYVGVTSVGDSPAEAQDRYDTVVSTLAREAAEATAW